MFHVVFVGIFSGMFLASLENKMQYRGRELLPKTNFCLCYYEMTTFTLFKSLHENRCLSLKSVKIQLKLR